MPEHPTPGLNFEALTQRLNELERLFAQTSRQHIPQTPSAADKVPPNSSHCSTQEHSTHEMRLCQRINFHAKIRLGYSLGIAVLNRELHSLKETEPHPPLAPKSYYDEGTLPSTLLASPEQSIFANTLQSVVHQVGLAKAVDILERATPPNALAGSSSPPSSSLHDPKLIETVPMSPPLIVSRSNSHSSSSTVRYSPYDMALNIDAPRWSGRGGKFKCDECRRAKRGWLVHSPPCLT